MKTNKSIWAMGGMIAAVMALSGCSAALFSSSSSSDDLYSTHDTRAIANSDLQRRERALAAREAELRRQEEAAKAAYQVNQAQRSGSESTSYQSVLSDNYQDSYERRLKGFSSSSYKVNSTVPDNTQIKAINYASAYDPAVYNVMVMGDEVWVEPKYISSLFGTWGSTSSVNLNFNLGWGWGSPYWGWNNWNWRWGNPYYSWYYPPYYGPSWGWYWVGTITGDGTTIGAGVVRVTTRLTGVAAATTTLRGTSCTANRVTAVTALRPDIIRTPAPVQVTAAEATGAAEAPRPLPRAIVLRARIRQPAEELPTAEDRRVPQRAA